MARPIKVSDSDILSAAREVFLKRGMRATTADVALRAGISEGTIFNRFKCKDDLFHAAMERELSEPTWLVDLCANVGKGDLDANLVSLGLAGLDYFSVAMPTSMMAWSQRDDARAQIAPLTRITRRLAAYFEAEMRHGRIRRHDAEIVARTFVGGLMSYAYMESVENAGDALPMPREMFVRGLVNVLRCGVSCT
jgi:AcrR family transcriptional regulator